MSLITQCPACSTMFRVVPDQLRISEGWVRCGQCDEVFDANAHLQHPGPTPFPTDAPVATVAPEFYSESSPASSREPANPVEAYDWGPVLSPQEPQSAEPAEDSALHSGLTQTGAQNRDEPYLEEPDSLEPSARAESAPQTDAFLAHSPHGAIDLVQSAATEALELPAAEPEFQAAADSANGVALPSAMAALPGDNAPPSFMPQSQGTQVSGRPLFRILLGALCLLLSGLLALQYLMLERDQLAAAAPSLRPLLAGACEWLGCTISAPRQIESIAIDSSAFTSLRPGVYVLNLTVKNRAAIELAMPALELTLTGLQEQALLRKVLLPADVFGKLQIPAGAEASASLPVRVVPGAAVDKVAGYRVLAFYP